MVLAGIVFALVFLVRRHQRQRLKQAISGVEMSSRAPTPSPRSVVITMDPPSESARAFVAQEDDAKESVLDIPVGVDEHPLDYAPPKFVSYDPQERQRTHYLTKEEYLAQLRFSSSSQPEDELGRNGV